ncbi:MAG: SOS response-associated peptidase [Myxococcota bacterium]
MCGRFTLSSSAEDVAREFALAEVPDLRPRYNVAPGQSVPVVRADESGRRELAFHRWGLVPSWAKDPSIGNRMINARSETVAEKPAFRAAFRRRRCLVPADGFYEWSGPRNARKAHWIRVAGGLFAIAGLYECWTPPAPPEGEERDDARADAAAGDPLWTCTLLTTEANAAIRPLHDRMPVILESRDHVAWLDPEEHDRDRLEALLVPAPPDRMEIVEVGSRVNDVRHDDPRCIEPAG